MKQLKAPEINIARIEFKRHYRLHEPTLLVVTWVGPLTSPVSVTPEFCASDKNGSWAKLVRLFGLKKVACWKDEFPSGVEGDELWYFQQRHPEIREITLEVANGKIL